MKITPPLGALAGRRNPASRSFIRSGSHLSAPAGQFPSDRQGQNSEVTPTGFLTVDRAGGCNGRHASASAVVNAGRMGDATTPANFVPGAIFFLVHEVV